MSVGASPPENPSLQLKPTMIIGIGGTGKDVLLRIRRLFFERQGRRTDGTVGYPIIGYLLVDTDDQSVNDIADDTLSEFVSESIALKPQGGIAQFIHCRVNEFAFNEYFAGGSQLYPHVARWLLPEFNKYGYSAIVGGAGQNRYLGRLAFYHNYRGTHERPGIRDTLTERIRDILAKATLPNLVQQWKPDDVTVEGHHLDVILVYSLAGGTGAGMFLDVGMLAREVVRDLDLPGLTSHFTHIAVLPEGFINDAPGKPSKIQQQALRRKIQENAFAALREMEYFSMRRSQAFDLSVPPLEPDDDEPRQLEPLYVAEWERGHPIPIQDTPWDNCYLVGSGNDTMGGASLPLNEIYQMISEYIFLDFDPSSFGTMKRMVRSNQRAVELEPFLDAVHDRDRDGKGGAVLYHRELSRRFRIFGLSQIFFDRARMRRAASYHLAHRLISKHWLRGTDLQALALNQVAQEDLIGGAQRDATLVTRTQQPDDPQDPQLRLSCEVLRDRILLKEGEKSKSWYEDVRDDADRTREQIERGSADYSYGKPILDLIDRHEVRLTPQKTKAGESGLVVRSLNDRRERLLHDIERRLRALFLFRLGEHGVPGTEALLKEYATTIEKQATTAERLANAQPKLRDPNWRARLEDARGLPLRRHAARALRAEAIRAVNQTKNYLFEAYTHAAGRPIRECLDRAQQRVSDKPGDNHAAGSFARSLRRFREGLVNGVLGHLGLRFQALTVPIANPTRTVGLYSDLKAADYDALILRTSAIKAINQEEGRDDVMNWVGIERAVLEKLRQSHNGRWRDATDLGALVLQLCPLPGETGFDQHVVDEFAKDLAEACEALLIGFVTDTTALNQFYAEPPDERLKFIDLFRTYSGPYLRKVQALQAALTDAHLEIALGISTINNKPDRVQEFRNEVVHPRQAHMQGLLVDLQFLDMKDDALVLFQEKIGIPICYYQGLEALGRLYDSSNRIKETHFDYPALRRRLPEVRQVDQDRQRLTAESLQNVIYGIITRQIWHDGRDYVMSRDQGGAPLDFPVGGQLADVVQFYAARDNTDDRTRLIEQVNAWIEQAARAADATALAALWCALQSLQEEIRRRVQYMIRRIDAGVRVPDHPLLSILAVRMTPRVKTRLERHPDGQRFVRSLLDWHLVAADRELDGAEKARRWDRWVEVVSPCFESRRAEGVIPVLRLPQHQIQLPQLVAAEDDLG